MKLPRERIKIMRGQMWKHKTSNRVILITGSRTPKNGNKCWANVTVGSRHSHSLSERDIQRFYVLI